MSPPLLIYLSIPVSLLPSPTLPVPVFMLRNQLNCGLGCEHQILLCICLYSWVQGRKGDPVG